MKKIAITGTMASGKSQVSLWLRQHRYPVFDCDGYSKICLLPTHPAYAKIVKYFGESILDANKEIDRGKLAQIVFEEEPKRKKLNSIIHPYVKKGLKEAMKKSKDKDLFFAEVPLLFEAKMEGLFDEILVVTCKQETAIKRCMNVRGYTRQQAIQRLQTQIDPKLQIAQATKVFYNDGTIKALEKQVAQWVATLRKGERHGTETKR